ncbi:hypothetical protein SAMN02744040_02324, partial [Tepidibacter thalassicus DSM 15285]
MSHNNFILNLLNLKDPNITFNDNYYSEEIINNVKSKVFYATLTYMPNTCYHCGHTMDKHII